MKNSYTKAKQTVYNRFISEADIICKINIDLNGFEINRPTFIRVLF